MEHTDKARLDGPANLKVIDADTHLTEPHDLWTKRAPAKYRDRVPQVKLWDGALSWVIDGDKSIGTGAPPMSVIDKHGVKAQGMAFRDFHISDVHPGSFDVKARLKVMDESGIWAQIVYPNILGFGGQRSAKVDPELRLITTQIYNDAMAEIQADSGGRIFPMALLPWWDVKAAVAETERCANMGLRGININSDPHVHSDDAGGHLPDLAQSYWDPLWETCVALDQPVNFHIGGSEQVMDWFGNQAWPSFEDDMRAALGGTMLFFQNGRTVANIIMSGMLDRHPKLKFVSVESGIGWIPPLLEALDYQYGEIAVSGTLTRRPSEYFESNFYACFWYETRNAAHSIRAVGVDNCLFETDFPHPTCLYPVTADTFAVPGLTNNELTKVLSKNAAGVYNIPV